MYFVGLGGKGINNFKDSKQIDWFYKPPGLIIFAFVFTEYKRVGWGL